MRVGNQAFDAATSLTPGGVLPVTATVPEVAVESVSSDTFLGARYRRLGPGAAASRRRLSQRLRDGRERFILRKAPDETARDEPQPHTALVGE